MSIPVSREILLIGRGRLAHHLAHDWTQVFAQTPDSPRLTRWDRSQPTSQLIQKLKSASLVAVAISDSALAGFIQQHQPHNPKAIWIHFSGALEVAGAQSFHPLMTFGPELYDDSEYRRIPFITTHESREHSTDDYTPFEWPAELQLPNPLYQISAAQKAQYHALCVLSGNFSSLLWEKAQTEFEKMGLDPKVLKPYAEKCLDNIFKHRALALTGPLVRGDFVTQEKNLAALACDPYQNVYRAFQQVFKKESP